MNISKTFSPSIKGNKENIYYEIFGSIPNDFDFFDYYKQPIIYTKQKHSIALNMIYDYEFNNTYLLGDGLFTNKKNLSLIIECRDCMGVIIIGNNFTGVVHISWKNLYLGIVDNIFNLLKKESINISLLDFIVTPHITSHSMEVKENFINLWKSHETYKDYINSDSIITYINNKYYFSMFNMLEKILINKYNIQKQNIYSIPIDTYTNNSYSSFRRDGLNNSNTNKVVVYIK
jgi:copper oxidase (laccase) domain-containing protein